MTRIYYPPCRKAVLPQVTGGVIFVFLIRKTILSAYSYPLLFIQRLAHVPARLERMPYPLCLLSGPNPPECLLLSNQQKSNNKKQLS